MNENALKTELLAKVKRRLKTLRKYLKKALERLEECRSHSEVQKHAELLAIHLFGTKRGKDHIVVEDLDTGKMVRVPISPLKTHQQNVQDHFKKAKKLRLGIPFAEKEVEKAQDAVTKWAQRLEFLITSATQEKLESLRNAIEKEIPSQPKQQSPREASIPKKPYREFLSSSNIPIWVGKSASMNEQTTFSWASGNDLWLHAAGCPGSHVVVHIAKGAPPDEETLQDALQLALYYSQAKNNKEAEIAVTQVKFVKRIGGQKGKVQISGERHIKARSNPERLKKLSNRPHL
jgi:predicted ribosome quality control (RQC) complex YloA/Tae2 family protein